MLIYGAGGHGKVVAEAAMLAGFSVVGFIDDNRPSGAKVLKDISIIASSEEDLSSFGEYFIVAIGDNKVRKQKYNQLVNILKPSIIIHPYAAVSDEANIGAGTVILAGAVINAGVEVGVNCIINSLSLIDHESRIGDNSHIAQGSIIGSNVSLSDESTTSLGERINSFTKR